MNAEQTRALDTLAESGGSLRSERRFDWPRAVQQAVYRLRLDAAGNRLPSFVAIVGGASSGKSTVFNNLIAGYLTSRIAARGHTTLGPILGVHERHRTLVERLYDRKRLLPGFGRVSIELNDNTAGKPDAVATVFHTVEALSDVFLFDLPDFTSRSAEQEGDISMSLLPWFDRIIIIVDHERWFDRQSVSTLRTRSVRFGQRRWVLFNRTREGALVDEDRTALAKQAERLGADGMSVLEFRRGQGFCLFPPGMLDGVHTFLAQPQPHRTKALLARVSEAANHVLNQNEERSARLGELHESLNASLERVLPSVRECMISLMTPPERQKVEPLSRVLRIGETKAWLTAQTRRFQRALRQVPIVGIMMGGRNGADTSEQSNAVDRLTIAESYFQFIARRQAHEIQRIVRASTFWEEIRRWTDLKPPERGFSWTALRREQVRSAAGAFDEALARWLEKVDAECRGLSPHIVGAIGAGGLGLAVALIAVPGPVALLTLASAKSAIGAALTHLAAAAGAGALLGKPMGRLIDVIQEKLLGSPEFAAVDDAAGAFRALLESQGRRLAGEAASAASRLVMERTDPLVKALECLREPPEETQ